MSFTDTKRTAPVSGIYSPVIALFIFFGGSISATGLCHEHLASDFQVAGRVDTWAGSFRDVALGIIGFKFTSRHGVARDQCTVRGSFAEIGFIRVDTSVLGITGVYGADVVVIAVCRSPSNTGSAGTFVIARTKLVIVTGSVIRGACAALIGLAKIICTWVAIIAIRTVEHRAFPFDTSVDGTRITVGANQVPGRENTSRFRRAGVQGTCIVVIAIGSPG